MPVRVRSRRVRAAAVHGAAGVEHHRSAWHLGRRRCRPGCSCGDRRTRWLPGTTRVAPFASVKSSSAQIVLTSTCMSSGNGKKSKHHWSRCRYCASAPGPMVMAWVRWSWKVVFFSHSTASATSSTSGWATISTELACAAEQRTRALGVGAGELVATGRRGRDVRDRARRRRGRRRRRARDARRSPRRVRAERPQPPGRSRSLRSGGWLPSLETNRTRGSRLGRSPRVPSP